MRRRRRTLLAEAYGRVVEIAPGPGSTSHTIPTRSTNSCSPNPNLERAGNSLAASTGRHAPRGSLTRPPSACRCPTRPWTPSYRRSSRAPSTALKVRFAKSHACSVPMGGCSSSNTSARSRGSGGVPGQTPPIMARLRRRVRTNWPTLELMRSCGFAVEADDVVWHGMPAIVHPLAVGCGAAICGSRVPVNPVR